MGLAMFGVLWRSSRSESLLTHRRLLADDILARSGIQKRRQRSPDRLNETCTTAWLLQPSRLNRLIREDQTRSSEGGTQCREQSASDQEGFSDGYDDSDRACILVSAIFCCGPPRGPGVTGGAWLCRFYTMLIRDIGVIEWFNKAAVVTCR